MSRVLEVAARLEMTHPCCRSFSSNVNVTGPQPWTHVSPADEMVVFFTFTSPGYLIRNKVTCSDPEGEGDGD